MNPFRRISESASTDRFGGPRSQLEPRQTGTPDASWIAIDVAAAKLGATSERVRELITEGWLTTHYATASAGYTHVKALEIEAVRNPGSDPALAARMRKRMIEEFENAALAQKHRNRELAAGRETGWIAIESAAVAAGAVKSVAPKAAPVAPPPLASSRALAADAGGMSPGELAAHRQYAIDTGRDPEAYVAELINERRGARGGQLAAAAKSRPRQCTPGELAAHRSYAEQTGRDPEEYLAELAAEGVIA